MIYKTLLLLLVLISLDQGSKMLVTHTVQSPIIVFDFFKILLVHNTGIGFSLPVPPVLTIILSSMIIVFLGFQINKKSILETNNLSIILIIGGALGNLIDRIFRGSVVDFLAVSNFPVFNIADILISCGVGLYLWETIKNKEK